MTGQFMVPGSWFRVLFWVHGCWVLGGLVLGVLGVLGCSGALGAQVRARVVRPVLGS